MADANPILDYIAKGYRYKETLPTAFRTKDLDFMARGAKYATSVGMPEIGFTSLANRILVEGRSDAGANEFNYNNPKASVVYDKVLAAGFPQYVAIYAGAVTDKADVAKRLGISFDEAWNGTGRSKDSGKTGKDYAARMQQMAGAVNDPRNADFVSYINRAAEGQLQPKEKLAKMTTQDIMKILYGRNDEANDLLSFNKSNLAKDFTQTSEKLTGKKEIPVDPADPKPRGLVYEQSVADVLAAVIRNKAGLNPRGPGDWGDTRKWIEKSPELQQVFDVLAQPALKQLGIEK